MAQHTILTTQAGPVLEAHGRIDVRRLASKAGLACLGTVSICCGVGICIPSPGIAWLECAFACMALVLLGKWPLPRTILILGIAGSALILISRAASPYHEGWNWWNPGILAMVWLLLGAGASAAHREKVLHLFILGACLGLAATLFAAGWYAAFGVGLATWIRTPVPAERYSIAYGLSGHHIRFGCSTLLVAIVCLWHMRRSRQRWLALPAALGLAAKSLSGSRTAMLCLIVACGAGIVLLCRTSLRRTVMAAICLAVLVAISLAHLRLTRAAVFTPTSLPTSPVSSAAPSKAEQTAPSLIRHSNRHMHPTSSISGQPRSAVNPSGRPQQA